MKQHYIIAGACLGGVILGVLVLRWELQQTRQVVREVASPDVPKSVENAVDRSVDQLNRQAARVTDLFSKADSVLGGDDANSPKGSGNPRDPVGRATDAAGQLGNQAAKLADGLLGGVLKPEHNDGSAQNSGSPAPLGRAVDSLGQIGRQATQAAEGLLKPPAQQPTNPKRRPAAAGNGDNETDPAEARPRSAQEDDSLDSTGPPPAKNNNRKRQVDTPADGDNQTAGEAEPAPARPRPAGSGGRGSDNPLPGPFGALPGGDLLGRALDASNSLTKSGDAVGQQLLGLSLEEERQWGRQLHQQVLQEHRTVTSATLKSRLAKLATPILASKRRDLKYTITVLDDDEVNAFSLAGGYIYLHKGIVKAAADDNELQFVLGHEIGHIDLGHCARQLTYAARASQVGGPAGNIVGILHNLLTRRYSQDMEFEADDYGYRACRAAGQSRDDALSFISHFDGYVNRGSSGPQAADAADQNIVQRLESHFHTHPPTKERLRRLEAIRIDSEDRR